MIDLKSDTAEKDRLHTEIFDTAKRMDEKMAEDRGSVGTQYEEEEEEDEERGGGLRKRRRIEEEEEEEEDEGGGGEYVSDKFRFTTRASRTPGVKGTHYLFG